MSFLLSAIGTVLLLGALTAIAFGIFMATDLGSRDQGMLFALWWIPGAAAATGVMMKDVVTFAIGSLCFCVAGLVFLWATRSTQYSSSKRGERADSEKTTRENRAAGYRRKAAS